MEVIAKDIRDMIKTKNGYFKYTLSGTYTTDAAITAGHSCKFNFQLPPLNEMGFSDKYNQCLIQFRSISLGSSALTANGLYGENATWFNKTGGLSGWAPVQVVSNIPCRNQQHLGAIDEAFWSHGGNIFTQTLSQKISDRIEAAPNQFGGVTDTSLYFLGTMENLLQGTIAGAAASNRYQVNRRNIWSYETDKDIWTGGQLCGIPMGTDVEFEIRSIYNNDLLCLSSNSGQADGTGTFFACELEIQLLPNPTPSNR